jgi:hypothetical protein
LFAASTLKQPLGGAVIRENNKIRHEQKNNPPPKDHRRYQRPPPPQFATESGFVSESGFVTNGYDTLPSGLRRRTLHDKVPCSLQCALTETTTPQPDPPFINPVAAVPVKKTRTNGTSVLVVFGGICRRKQEKQKGKGEGTRRRNFGVPAA